MNGKTTKWPAARVPAVIAAAALGLSLAACAPSGGDSAGGDAPDELVLAGRSVPGNLDPGSLSEGETAYVWSGLFDTLLTKNPETGEIEANAAESWEYSEDGLTLTLALRDGMTFSSGDAVTAEAVVATMERRRATPGYGQPFFAVDTITAVDDSTVELTFTEYDPGFITTLADVTGVIGDPATMDADSTDSNPVASGPYTLDLDRTIADTTYVLTKRDDYWNADAFPFDTVTYQVFADPTAGFNALQSGEVNASTVSAQQLGPVEGNDTFTLNRVEGLTGVELSIIDKGGDIVPELADPRVRQAINHAIDREGIVNALAPGAGTATSQSVGINGDAYVEELDSYYEYDPERARELLAEAGHADGITVQIPSTYLSSPLEALLGQQLGEAGITPEWVPTTPADVAGINSSGRYGLTVSFGGFGGGDFFRLDYLFGETGSNNPTGYTDETLQQYFTELRSTTDQEAAAPVYQDLNRYTVEQALNVPIARLDVVWVTRDGVRFLDEGQSGSTLLRNFGVAS